MKGRKPMSDQLKVLRGTDQPCRMRGQLILSDIIKMPPAPKYFSKISRKYYKTVGIYLLQAKIITAIDIGVLEMCCYEFGRYHDLSQELAKMKMTDITFEQGQDFQRLRTAVKQSFDRWLKLAIELGMTPSSRLKFNVVKEITDPVQEIMERFG
jgi:P27 family predicted phage terminase small subunit